MKIKGIPKKKIEELRNALRRRGVWKSIASKVIWTSFVPLIISVVAVIISAQALITANTGLIATTRPYLSVANITEKTIDDGHISVLVVVKNFGKLPATSVGIQQISLDGEQWVSIIDTPEETYTNEYGVTMTVSGILVLSELSQERQDFPESIVFYPEQPTQFVMTVIKDEWEMSINTGSVMEIGLNYTWGKHDYWYIATSMLAENREWKITLHRGN